MFECSIFTSVSFLSLWKMQVFFLPKQCDIILNASHVQIKIRIQYSVIRHLKAQILLVFWYWAPSASLLSNLMSSGLVSMSRSVKRRSFSVSIFSPPSTTCTQKTRSYWFSQQHRSANQSPKRATFIFILQPVLYAKVYCKRALLLWIQKLCKKQTNCVDFKYMNKASYRTRLYIQDIIHL